MSYKVNFEKVEIIGLETSPFKNALAGLRANEARYFKNKYDYEFITEKAEDARKAIQYVDKILKEERNIVITSKALEATSFKVENINITYVFYESGLEVNVMYTIDDPKKRAVGFKLSEGMAIPDELKEKFNFATQKSKLAGIIRGSFFVIKKEY